VTEPEEKKGRTRHVLKRSALHDAPAETAPAETEALETTDAETADIETTAVEPESTALETTAAVGEAATVETVEAPVAAETEATETDATEPEVAETEATAATESVAREPAQPGGGTAAKVIAFGVLPFLALLLVIGVGGLKFFDVRSNAISTARDQAVQAAKDSTVTLLSYNPDTVEQQLTDARGLLTGEFKDSYTQLTTDVVIPGAKQQRISAVATVPRAASVSTETDNAVVLVFVNQTVVVGDSQPSATLSSVRVTLQKVDGKWLISKFDPV
jgi:Mce-associated membrane protein